MKKVAYDLFRVERELIEQCGLSKKRFHKVGGARWKQIYQAVTEKYADKTKTWKNGLHWANINGYSPKSMREFAGSFPMDGAAWFFLLPQMVPENEMVYFLIDKSSGWHLGEKFWIFESYIPELVKALELLNQTAFLDTGWADYYIVSKKFRWLIGFNHHDIVSCIGEGLDLDCLKAVE